MLIFNPQKKDHENKKHHYHPMYFFDRMDDFRLFKKRIFRQETQ